MKLLDFQNDVTLSVKEKLYPIKKFGILKVTSRKYF